MNTGSIVANLVLSGAVTSFVAGLAVLVPLRLDRAPTAIDVAPAGALLLPDAAAAALAI